MKTNAKKCISNSKEFEDFMRDETKKEAHLKVKESENSLVLKTDFRRNFVVASILDSRDILTGMVNTSLLDKTSGIVYYSDWLSKVFDEKGLRLMADVVDEFNIEASKVFDDYAETHYETLSSLISYKSNHVDEGLAYEAYINDRYYDFQYPRVETPLNMQGLEFWIDYLVKGKQIAETYVEKLVEVNSEDVAYHLLEKEAINKRIEELKADPNNQYVEYKKMYKTIKDLKDSTKIRCYKKNGEEYSIPCKRLVQILGGHHGFEYEKPIKMMVGKKVIYKRGKADE